MSKKNFDYRKLPLTYSPKLLNGTLSQKFAILNEWVTAYENRLKDYEFYPFIDQRLELKILRIIEELKKCDKSTHPKDVLILIEKLMELNLILESTSFSHDQLIFLHMNLRFLSTFDRIILFHFELTHGCGTSWDEKLGWITISKEKLIHGTSKFLSQPNPKFECSLNFIVLKNLRETWLRMQNDKSKK